MQPLTHHEIIGLVEPFSRRGRHVDLGASQRLERRLVFKPVEHGLQALGLPVPPGASDPTASAGLTGLRETLTLENPREGAFKLTRVLQLGPGRVAGLVGGTGAGTGQTASASASANTSAGTDTGLSASLVAEGPDAGALLQHVEAVTPQRQFSVGEGFVAALSFRLEVQPAGADLVLAEAVAQVPGHTLTMRVPRVQGMSAEIELAATTPGSGGTLPGDLLAVIGWDWAPLDARRDFWQSKLRLRGGAQRRSAGAEAKLQRTLRHLAHTLVRPPGEFHDRHAAARWGVVFRRGIPVLTVIGMFAGVAALPRMDLDEMSPLRMFAFHLPTLLLAVAFTMQELPRFEIPPWPRRLKMAAWTVAPIHVPPDVAADVAPEAPHDAPAAAPSPTEPDPAAPFQPLEPAR